MVINSEIRENQRLSNKDKCLFAIRPRGRSASDVLVHENVKHLRNKLDVLEARQQQLELTKLAILQNDSVQEAGSRSSILQIIIWNFHFSNLTKKNV